MFNFKKNNNDNQSIQNPNPNLNIPIQTPIQNPVNNNQVQDDPNQPLTTPPNLDDFDPPTPVFDLSQTPAPNLNNLPQTPQSQPIPDQSTLIQPIPSQPQPNIIPDLDSQITNFETTTPSTNDSEESQGEDIMADISNFQEDFNTKYDKLAEKIRQFLNKKIKENKETKIPETNLETLLEEKPSKTLQPTEEVPQMSQNLAQDEIAQRQAQMDSEIKPQEESNEELNLINQNEQIEDTNQSSQLNPTDLPANPGTLK